MIIRPEFESRALNDRGIAACNEVRWDFTELLTKLEATIPAGRERSLVVTKLQEACGWAVRAVTTMPVNQSER
jgi:hypothetical protein